MIRCDGCNKLKKTKGVVRIKGQALCNSCRHKLSGYKVMESTQALITKSNSKLTIEDAEKKEYIVRETFQKKVGVDGITYYIVRCYISVPPCFLGRKIKIQDAGISNAKKRKR